MLQVLLVASEAFVAGGAVVGLLRVLSPDVLGEPLFAGGQPTAAALDVILSGVYLALGRRSEGRWGLESRHWRGDVYRTHVKCLVNQ